MKIHALVLTCTVAATLGFGVHAEQAKPHYDAATIKRCQAEENPGPARGLREFHPDQTTPGLPWPAERDADTSAPMAASVYTALEQQLGLKLEKTKAPRGFIVIDHVERPGPDLKPAGLSAVAWAKADGTRSWERSRR